MSNSEGKKTADELTKMHWNVRFVTVGGKGAWMASHEDAPGVILRWSKNVHRQRVRDQAYAALGVQQRTRSGLKIKERQASQRRRNKEQELSRERAQAKAMSNVNLMCAPKTRLSAAAQKRYQEVSLTSTGHSFARAIQRGITGPQIQQALASTVVEQGYNNCAVFVGTACRVVVDPYGNIVTVIN